jgi:UDP-N-acetylmuramoylalanine--D-glutamate ligase
MPTRPKISWSELRGATVGVWGLGVEGRANLRRLETMGVRATLVDDRPTDADADALGVLSTDGGGLAELERCDVVLKSPGISRYRPDVQQLAGRGVAVVGGLGLWMEDADRSRVACVTGTKGKSTTAAIAGHLLQRLGYDCLVGGNIGVPPWDPSAGDRHDFWIVETSSFQATDLATSPPLVAVTSLHPDHLDWHGDERTYFADKLSICSQPDARCTIANGDDATLRARREMIGEQVEWVSAGTEDEPADGGGWSGALGLSGAHNRRNARIARSMLVALGVPEASDPVTLAGAAEGFQPLGSRLQIIGTIGAVRFVDDSLSTNALSAVVALGSFPGARLAIVVGGHDRGIDYGELADAAAARAEPTLVLCLPASGQRIADAVRRAVAEQGSPTEVTEHTDLAGATALAYDWARPDGVVLLSPASPSFGTFVDYRHRAAVFAEAMRSLTAPGTERGN